ncbi:hypothetical protein [Microbulbifer taiwanensis]|uniref:Uncharacterized protein n=1 Tax=Microbulbifer taiwanensis TaxID=986746 RepID=A0ABW1YJU9_9GAMM|nr:hypothetical protein [Microbulbifer taiwanensis]
MKMLKARIGSAIELPADVLRSMVVDAGLALAMRLQEAEAPLESVEQVSLEAKNFHAVR